MTMVAFALLGGIGASAQTVYDAAKFINKDLTGTARYVGMGGAMGALGGDISTMGTNPAGIGIYRSNDIMATMNYSMNGTSSKYGGMKFTEDKNKFSFNNIGAVLSTKVGDHTSLRFVNFGFNYQRTNSFYKNMTMEGVANMAGLTQASQMANQAYGADERDLNASGAFNKNDIGWLSALAYQGYLIDFNPTAEFPGQYSPILGIDQRPYMYFNSREAGGIDNYDFNISFNFNDRIYLGLTVGAYDINYRKFSVYDESYDDYGAGHGLTSSNYIDGTGFDVKFGIIARPFEDSPFRLGFAVHTPTYYKLTLSTGAVLESDLYVNGELDYTRVDTYNALGGYMMDRDFKLHTPWLFNASLGYTIGTNLAFGAEYEYEDYSSMKFKYADYGTMPETEIAKEMTKGVSTFRIGAEYKVAPEFSVRAGYNYSTAIFRSDAWKDMPYNSINTDTDFANSKGISNYTLGFGYRGKSFYTDLAYKFNNYKEDFYAFDNLDLAPTKVTNNNHQILLTLGMRF